jgi:hypothetical protein
MTIGSGSASGSLEATPASLLTLIQYLELSLDSGKGVVMMRRDPQVFSVCLGNPENEEEALKSQGTITAAVANEILERTQAGMNRLTAGNQTYRFFRSFTHIAGVGAVVFVPA